MALHRTRWATNFENRKTAVSMIKELWAFLRVRKKLWLWPVVIVMALLGVLIVLAEGSAVAPFIYSLF
jgi:hypothetical protein